MQHNNTVLAPLASVLFEGLFLLKGKSTPQNKFVSIEAE